MARKIALNVVKVIFSSTQGLQKKCFQIDSDSTRTENWQNMEAANKRREIQLAGVFFQGKTEGR